MKTQQFLVGGIALILMVAVTVGLSQAQAPVLQQAAMPQSPVGNAFTYQGYLKDGSSPANGEYDFQFILYNALTGGSQVGTTVPKDNVTVTNGLFSVALDFGSVFDGTGLWLEAGVRPGSSTGSYQILSPRQEVTPAPYALYAVNIPTHDHLGLAKAAVFASVGSDSPTIHRYFNTVSGQVSIWACGIPPHKGHSCLDFDFDLSGRFWVGMAYQGGYVSCFLRSGTNDNLDCVRYDAAGNLASGDIMVLVY